MGDRKPREANYNFSSHLADYLRRHVCQYLHFFMIPTSRIYVQYLPKNKDQLVRLQDDIAEQVSGVKFVPSSQLHMTVIHFGVAKFVYHHVRKILPHLSEAEFDQHLSALIAQYQRLSMPPLELRTTQLVLLGPGHGVLALGLYANQRLVDLHQQAYQLTVHWFEQFGLSHSEAKQFMMQDRNLLHAHELNPHITLARGVNQVPELDLPALIKLDSSKISH